MGGFYSRMLGPWSQRKRNMILELSSFFVFIDARKLSDIIIKVLEGERDEHTLPAWECQLARGDMRTWKFILRWPFSNQMFN